MLHSWKPDHTFLLLIFTKCKIKQLTSILFFSLQRNPMKKLSHMTLDHCHNVTVSFLHDLLDKENELNVLTAWSCALITKTHSIQLSQRIEQENMDIYFEWFSI